MKAGIDPVSIILVVEDVEETRDGIEELLEADGYRVHSARNVEDAIGSAQREHPNLILMASSGPPVVDAAAIADRIRGGAGLGEDVPVVIFCIPTLAEGAEAAVGRNIYVTRPDNFDQLRDFLQRRLHMFHSG
jgi:CheY-like chemotaxis protein